MYQQNLQDNITTHIMFSKNNYIEHIDIKPYLILEERINKGYKVKSIRDNYFVKLEKEITKLLSL